MRRILNVATDLIIIYSSFLLAYYLLYKNGMLLEPRYNFGAFVVISPLIVFLYLVLMYTFGLYNIIRQKYSELIYTVLLISVSLMVSVMAVCFFVRNAASSLPRSVILLSALFYFFGLLIWKSIAWRWARKSHGTRKVMVVGKDAALFSLKLSRKYSEIYSVEYICQEDDLEMDHKIREVNDIFITASVSQETREYIFFLATELNKETYFIPDYVDLGIMTSSFEKIDDVPTFRIPKMDLTLEERFVKRGLDLLLTSIASIVALPIGLVVAFLIKLDGGSVFYSQERLTRDNRAFKVLKFRTMVPNAEKLSGPVLAGENDPRITKIGRILRATRLDEIPQLWNILTGDMSIVGPRPERPFFVKQFEQDIPEYHYRLKVKAGLTGLAQVEGKYNTTVENKLRYDLIYINNYSLFRDLLIMLQTVKILFIKSSTEGVESKESEVKQSDRIQSLSSL